MVELKMSSETERGPGPWVVNVSFLNDHKFRDLIIDDWIEFQDYYYMIIIIMIITLLL